MAKKKVIKRKKTRSKAKTIISKKITIPTKIIFSVLLTYFIALSYFLLLIYLEPRSVPIIKDKVNEILQSDLNLALAVNDSVVSFLPSGNLRISLKDFAELERNAKQKNISFDISQLDLDIPLSRLILFNFGPKKAYLRQSQLVVNQDEVSSQVKKDNFNQDQFVLALNNKFKKFLGAKIPLKELYIDKIDLVLLKPNLEPEIITIDNSAISFARSSKNITLSSISNVVVNDANIDLRLSLNCLLKQKEHPSCNIFINNFRADSLASFSTKFELLKQIEAELDLKIVLDFIDGGFSDIKFNIASQKGSFDFPNFFSQKMDFRNFKAHGNYQIKSKALNLSQINTSFISNLAKNHEFYSNPDFSMSLFISDIIGPKKDLYYKIQLKNVPNDEMSKYWPSGLPGKNIKQWVTSNITKGMVDSANAEFKISYFDGDSELQNIESEINFSDFYLKYDDYFPPISAISGVANFNERGMDIEIASGNLLDSNIKQARLVIEDFFAPTNILKISANTNGPPQDLLKHIDYKSKYAKNIKNYLNGLASSNINIEVPIQDNIDLVGVDIDISTIVSKLNTDFAAGSAQITAKKPLSSNVFINKINLDNAKLKIPALGIEKEPKIKSRLSFDIVAKDKELLIDKVLLTKVKNLTQFGGNISKSKVSGNIIIDRRSRDIIKASLRNHNFGKNNYLFNYSNKNSAISYDLSGTRLDLADLINYKLPLVMGNNIASRSLNVSFDVGTAFLMNEKLLKNFRIDLNCQYGFCNSGLVTANYGNEQMLNISIKQDEGKDYANIRAIINNSGYLAEGIGITNLLSGGDIKIHATNKMVNDKNFVKGNLKILDQVTFYETERLKLLSQDELFFKIRDKIFSKGKTIFDNVDSEFEVVDGNIFIKSFVANNFKVGVTAKGNIDLNNRSFALNGMIVPGFIVNNLFGVGKIPLVGDVVSGLLTGGEEGGGLFGIRYNYVKESKMHKEQFKTEKVKSFLPTTIKSLFDLI